jgi:hypothetical protein
MRRACSCSAQAHNQSMKNLLDTLLTIAVLGGILVLSAVVTNLFTRKVYFTCGECRSLNAKRRTHCRVCGQELTG